MKYHACGLGAIVAHFWKLVWIRDLAGRDRDQERWLGGIKVALPSWNYSERKKKKKCSILALGPTHRFLIVYILHLISLPKFALLKTCQILSF